MSKVRYPILTVILNETYDKYLMSPQKCKAIPKIILVSYSTNLPRLTSLFEIVTGSLIVPDWSQILGDVMLCMSSVFVLCKAEIILGSRDISKETSNTFNRFKWGFQLEFHEFDHRSPLIVLPFWLQEMKAASCVVETCNCSKILSKMAAKCLSG